MSVKEFIPTIAWITFAAFLIGCAGPILFYWIVLGIQRLRGTDRNVSVLVIMLALFITFGLGTVGLIYLSMAEAGSVPIIGLAFGIGYGLIWNILGDP
jgi:hypothetical protein